MCGAACQCVEGMPLPSRSHTTCLGPACQCVEGCPQRPSTLAQDPESEWACWVVCCPTPYAGKAGAVLLLCGWVHGQPGLLGSIKPRPRALLLIVTVPIGAAALHCRYALYLFWQLRTHSDLFMGDDDGDEPVMTLGGALLGLTAITATVAFCSE